MPVQVYYHILSKYYQTRKKHNSSSTGRKVVLVLWKSSSFLLWPSKDLKLPSGFFKVLQSWGIAWPLSEFIWEKSLEMAYQKKWSRTSCISSWFKTKRKKKRGGGEGRAVALSEKLSSLLLCEAGARLWWGSLRHTWSFKQRRKRTTKGRALLWCCWLLLLAARDAEWP